MGRQGVEHHPLYWCMGIKVKATAKLTNVRLNGGKAQDGQYELAGLTRQALTALNAFELALQRMAQVNNGAMGVYQGLLATCGVKVAFLQRKTTWE